MKTTIAMFVALVFCGMMGMPLCVGILSIGVLLDFPDSLMGILTLLGGLVGLAFAFYIMFDAIDALIHCKSILDIALISLIVIPICALLYGLSIDEYAEPFIAGGVLYLLQILFAYIIHLFRKYHWM